MTTWKRFAAAMAVALIASASVWLRPIVSARQQPAQSPAAMGQSATQLADGRWLVLGGESGGVVSRAASILDPATGVVTPLASAMVTPRTGLTATLLADGTVLVVGGRGALGQMAETAELFDPQTGAFMPMTFGAATPRSGHSATLLGDGRVLVAGGDGIGGRAESTVEIWDPRAQRVEIIGRLSGGRTGHTATLSDDGRVRVSGGVDQNGRTVTSVELLNPADGRVVTAPFPADDGTPAHVTGSSPLDGALDVPIDTRVMLQVSRPLRVDTVNASTVALHGAEGPLDATVVAAENGRLIFVTPRSALRFDATYTLSIGGATDGSGVPLVAAPITFVTAKDASAAAAVDDESWIPDERSRQNGWRSERPPSPWESLPPLMAAPGVTAISGRVLTLEGKPLPRVALRVEGDAETHSDGTGRFLLELHAAASGRRVLQIDGVPASHPTTKYGFFEYGATVAGGTTNVLPFTIWMPKLDTAHQVTIPSPTTSEVVITTPYIPGLELHLPPGTTITGEDGKPVTTLGITPIPVDRPPFPLARNVVVPVYFTIQPGGAYVHGSGAWLVYPNDGRFELKQRVRFYHYDPDIRDWYVYGGGTAAAKQVFPDATTRLYAFTGAMINGADGPGAGGATPGGGTKADPVDPSTGTFVMHKTDLYLPDVIPIALTRTYNSMDGLPRPLGRSMTHPYAMFLYSEHQYFEADLILPEGGKVHYVLTAGNGIDYANVVLTHQEDLSTSPPKPATPTAFYKSTIRWNGSGWNLTLKDGTVYVFGNEAPLQAIRDRYGNQVTIAHANGQSGNVTQVTSPNGRWIQFAYTDGRVSSVTDNIGRSVGYTYDANGNLSTATDPEGKVTTYTYTAGNQMAAIKDGRNIVYLTNEYTNARVTKQTLADPNATYTFAYTLDTATPPNITQTDITDPRGHVERLSFNSDHYLVTDVEAVGTDRVRTTTYERPTHNNFASAVIDGLNRRTEYTYDTAGHVLTVKRLANTPDWVTTTFTYEPQFNQLATITDPLTHTWTMGYDALGRIARVTDPLTHQTVLTTNPAGQITGLTDALQHTSTFGYKSGDLVTASNPVGSSTQRFLDGAGRVLAMTDALGRKTRMTPDKLNRVLETDDAAGGQTLFTYDPNGNLTALTDALSHTTSYTYDSSDRVSTRTDPLQKEAAYLYDAKGNVTTAVDRKGQITQYQYDELDRVTQVTYADASSTQYVYDAGDRLRQVIDSVSGTILREYDGLDRLLSETTPEGTVSYTYDKDGRRETMTVPGQSQVGYGYDDAHRLLSITQGSIVVSFGYDDANRRSSLTLPNGIVTSYGYDNANQLTDLTYTLGASTLGTLTYTYDLAGNRIAVGGSWARTGLPAALGNAMFDAANRIQTWSGQSMSYDPNGNLTSDGPTSYTWNARNQLSGLSGGVSASFAYDGMGRRRVKTINGTTTSFLYDGFNFVQELSGGLPIANLLTGIGIDEIFTRTDSSGTSSLLLDALRSTLELADTSGTLKTHYTFEPFGGTVASGAASTNTQVFTGRENDGVLYYNRSRYVSPSTGRFSSEDPAQLEGDGPNLFLYARDNPILYIDPFGLRCTCVYHQTTGSMRCVNDQGDVVLNGPGYSGNGAGLDNPAMEAVRNVGPIPAGHYAIGLPFNSPHLGPITMPLTPSPDTDTHGRDGFYIHPDNHNRPPNSSSNGCIVLPPNLRRPLGDCRGGDLTVVP